MPASRSRTAFRATLATSGVVAVGAGLRGVVKGGEGVLQGGPVSRNIDSELRFFAAWYAVAGGLALTAVRRPEHETTAVPALATGFALAAAGRLLSWRRHGPPHPLFQALLAAELTLAATLLPWHRHLKK